MGHRHNIFKVIGKLIKAIMIICSVVAVIAGIFDQIGQAKEKKEAKKTGKKIHKMNGPYERFFKRPLDAFLSTGALIVLSPVMLILAMLVRLRLGNPVFFKHERPGKKEKIFKLYKFRTMTNVTDKDGKLLPDQDRLTNFGLKLRRTSLDELPELFNILKGDMSIVGPRPLEKYFLPYYTEEEHHRHDVMPGLTGLAQINGRNNLRWEEKFHYDLDYSKNITFFGDVRIVLKTIKKVLKEDGVKEEGGATIVDFDIERKNKMEKENGDINFGNRQ